MADKANNYTEAFEELHRCEKKVLKGLFEDLNGIGDNEIKPVDTTIIRNMGNPSAIHFLVRNRTRGGKEYLFNARYYNSYPKKYKGQLLSAKKDYLSYEFLSSLNTFDTPKSLFLKEVPRWLFTSHIPGETLKTIFDKEYSEEEKENLPPIVDDRFKEINSLIEAYVLFQNRAKERVEKLENHKRRLLFYSRDVVEQTKDYLNIISRKGVEKIVIDTYDSLIGNAVRGKEVCHGDLSPDNVIRESSGKIYLIDPELKFRNEFADIGSFISYTGDMEYHWDSFAELFKISKEYDHLKSKGIDFAIRDAKTMTLIEYRLDISEKEEQAIKENLSAREYGEYKGAMLNFSPQMILSPEAKQKACFQLYANILHHSLRIVAKRMRSNESASYRRQLDHVAGILGQFKTDPEKFGLKGEDVKKVELLDDFLKKSCFIEREKAIQSQSQ